MNLKLKEPYMTGPAVTRLQELGDLLGYDYGKNDGVFGEKTEKVVLDFQGDNPSLKKDGICGPLTWTRMLAVADAAAIPIVRTPTYYDIRRQHPKPKLYKCYRDLDTVTGILMHQTGCNMPSNPLNWGRLNAHISATTEGKTILVNSFTDYIHHGHGFSATTVGFEIEGNFQGIEGNDRTRWKKGGPAAKLNDDQIRATNRGMELIVDTLGDRLKFIGGHRQSKNTRQADPGSEIWQKIALPWIEKLGLNKLDMNLTRGSGAPIPREWGNDSGGRYWG